MCENLVLFKKHMSYFSPFGVPPLRQMFLTAHLHEETTVTLTPMKEVVLV